MSLYNARSSLKSALEHVNPDSDPVNWSVINALLEIVQAMAQMESDLREVKNSIR